MNTAAIIAEYNPFHNGHAYHVEQTRKLGYSHIIAVMSGNFVQRGTPAMLDRFLRAQAAVQCGVDLVLELPLPWSSSAAPDFADGATQIIKACGIVDAISFGCEHNDVATIKNAINLVYSETIQDGIKKYLQQGNSYPVAVSAAARDLGQDEIVEFLTKPNNMLALEYCKHLIHTNIKSLPVKRKGCEHDSDEICSQFASASHIRKRLYNSSELLSELENMRELLPRASAEIIKSAIHNKTGPLDISRYDIAAISRLQSLSALDFSKLSYVSNGLENRLYNAVQQAVTLDEAYAVAKNKQITHARIRRTLLHSVLGTYNAEKMITVPYIRVLAMNIKGRELLRSMQDAATLPILMRYADTDKLDSYGKSVYNFNQRANDLYNFCLPNPKPCGHDNIRNIYIEK